MDTAMRKIMLVDRHEPKVHCVLTNYLSNHFRKSGIEIEHANSGREAIDKLSAHPLEYAVVITDRAIPNDKGVNLISEIQRHRRLKNIPVVVLDYQEGSTDQIIRTVLNQAGLYDYLPQPFDRRSLLDIIDRAIGNVRQFISNSFDLSETADAEV
jgi:DNA-binding NtrC family response regulator